MQTMFFDHRDQFKVRVYRNLNKAGPNFGCWSVKSMYGRNYGRVVLHCSDVIVAAARCVVGERARQRVIREKSKNVHAYIEGYIIAATVLEERYDVVASMVSPSNGPLCPSVEDGEVEISYNPYKAGYFYEKATDLPVQDGFECHLNEDHTVSISPAPIMKLAA